MPFDCSESSWKLGCTMSVSCFNYILSESFCSLLAGTYYSQAPNNNPMTIRWHCFLVSCKILTCQIIYHRLDIVFFIIICSFFIQYQIIFSLVNVEIPSDFILDVDVIGACDGGTFVLLVKNLYDNCKRRYLRSGIASCHLNLFSTRYMAAL